MAWTARTETSRGELASRTPDNFSATRTHDRLIHRQIHLGATQFVPRNRSVGEAKFCFFPGAKSGHTLLWVTGYKPRIGVRLFYQYSLIIHLQRCRRIREDVFCDIRAGICRARLRRLRFEIMSCSIWPGPALISTMALVVVIL